MESYPDQNSFDTPHVNNDQLTPSAPEQNKPVQSRMCVF